MVANFVLADEINRAPAKVQSALLEAMQERQVTIGRETYPLPDPFLVMATQNPIESEGTYPLPEAQVDRFMLKVLIDYPTPTEEFVIVDRIATGQDSAGRALDAEQLAGLQRAADAVFVDPALTEYAVKLSNATRDISAVGLQRSGALHHLRRQPACVDQHDPRGPRARARSRSRVRAAATTSGRSPPTSSATVSCSRTRRWPTASPRTTSSTASSRPCPFRTSRSGSG